MDGISSLYSGDAGFKFYLEASSLVKCVVSFAQFLMIVPQIRLLSQLLESFSEIH